MKKLMKFLPALAMVLGIAAAVTGAPKADPVRKGLKSDGTWAPVTATYRCEEEEESVCTMLFNDAGDPIVGSEQPGIYIP